MPTTRRQCKNSGRKSTEYEQLEVSYQHTICTGVSQWCKSLMMTVKVEFSINTIELKVKFLYNHLNAEGICLRTSFYFKIRTNHRPQKWDGNTYTLFDGLTYNTRGYFGSCEQWAKCPRVLYVKPSNKRFIIPRQKGVILIQFYLVRVFLKKCIICPSGCLRTMSTAQKASQINILYLIV